MPELPHIERRKPVWVALSRFYLDTELSDQELTHIRDVFASSGYSIDEIQEIERNEVRCAIGVNLLGVAGVWSGFDEEWLCNEIIRCLAKGGASWWQRIWLRDSLTERYWARIAQLE